MLSDSTLLLCSALGRKREEVPRVCVRVRTPNNNLTSHANSLGLETVDVGANGLLTPACISFSEMFVHIRVCARAFVCARACTRDLVGYMERSAVVVFTFSPLIIVFPV